MNASRSTLQVDATMGYGNALAISPNYGTSKGNYIGAVSRGTVAIGNWGPIYRGPTRQGLG
ncbi:hypothetical protein N7497_001678 [Penicillium chrysogenum]|uniref:Uncharacterized protein n=1 Tax=Penicillium chrysogenum TaxID=5076 RepID=A0ABQ8WVS9_PENCH|nr:hypothetical protein N7505_001135 [Penicillium chrysogenum]KAJ6168835.1 hypothetical protein N7497_001678 [Penicillium chrysogenum]